MGENKIGGNGRKKRNVNGKKKNGRGRGRKRNGGSKNNGGRGIGGGDGLRSKVIGLRSSRNDDGRKYFPMCSYYRHLGFIADEYVCQTRECRHYNTLYLDNGENVRPYSNSVEKLC